MIQFANFWVFTIVNNPEEGEKVIRRTVNYLKEMSQINIT